MTDFESQLRDAMNAAVADAEPPRPVLELVRRRYRRRNGWSAVAGALALAVAVAAVLAAGALRDESRPVHQATSGSVAFPGGGKILVATGGGLAWLYPDGRTSQFASGFAGATPGATGLLAWKQTSYGFSYYTMNLDGSDSRLVLPAGHSRQLGNQDAQLSPDGSRLAYWVQDIHPGGAVTREIWSLDLRTGRKTDLGLGSGPVWKDNATILADSADQRSLRLLNVGDGRRTTYLTVSDPRLIRAYQQARPGAGPPAFISADGWSAGPDPSALAVSMSGRGAAAGISKPAEFLVEDGRILVFAPALSSPGTAVLILTWGPHGVFLLHSGVGDNPASWVNRTYAGTARSERLSRVQAAIDPGWDAGTFNPDGNVIALSQGDGSFGAVTFVPVPLPACRQAGTCLHFQPKQLSAQGTVLAWVP